MSIRLKRKAVKPGIGEVRTRIGQEGREGSQIAGRGWSGVCWLSGVGKVDVQLAVSEGRRTGAE